MTTLKIDTYNVVTLDECALADIYGGGIIRDAAKAIGYAVGYAAGAVKDFITGGDYRANETLMNCI
jgi:hypothetical protein